MDHNFFFFKNKNKINNRVFWTFWYPWLGFDQGFKHENPILPILIIRGNDYKPLTVWG
jgi:hypothetical protein